MRIEIDVERRLESFRLKASFSCDAPVTALFGRSGCGKSTLLNLVAGLLRPDRGRIAIGDRVLFDVASGVNVPPEQRRVGYVFQDGLLLPHLSVRQNLLYGRFFTPPQERWADIGRVVALLDLAPLLERRPRHLSGGEKQRVALGRALLASPRLLLMDEPLASLDAGRRGEILYYIERLRDEVRVPILYVSHEIEEVVRLAGHMVLLSDGRVAASGEVHDLMGRMELRGLIGRYEGGAVIEAKVAAQDLDSGLARLAFTGGELLVADVDALVGESLRVRVRARDVSIALERPRDISILNCFAGRIAEIGIEPGSSVDVRIDIAGTPILARITRHSAARLRLAAGQEVWALVKAVSFDRQSVGYA
ncbi:MAG TPA: molybdenum ABC transporter ATP-binding protein [Burkholderiales bacterium]|nr:molybdenum ABC transporter ATP-binding protein [Burkholderiales bacterium]